MNNARLEDRTNQCTAVNGDYFELKNLFRIFWNFSGWFSKHNLITYGTHRVNQQQAIRVHQADEQSCILVSPWLDCDNQKETQIPPGDKEEKARDNPLDCTRPYRPRSLPCVQNWIRESPCTLIKRTHTHTHTHFGRVREIERKHRQGREGWVKDELGMDRVRTL